jgi:hypothetical protein
MGTLAAYDIRQLKTKYNTDIFFETGTAEGNGVLTATQFGFKTIYTVEIMAEQVKILKERFKGLFYSLDSTVHLIEGDSLTALQKHLPLIQSNIMFWLDAHYPGADLIQNDISTKIHTYVGAGLNDSTIRLPLASELALIKQLRPNHKDVILLDDLNIYSNNISPEAYWLMPQQRFTENFYKDILKDTHTFQQINEMQGVLIPND